MNSELSTAQKSLLMTAGSSLASALLVVAAAVKPGITTAALNQIAEQELAARNCRPSFKKYLVLGTGRYPASLCVSINDEIVHGLPRADRVLANGDIVSLDLGAEYQGIYADMAVTVPVGSISAEADKLIEVTRSSLEVGIKSIVPGATIGDIGSNIAEYAENRGFSVIRDYVGHGIGIKPHQSPQIPNFGRKGSGPLIENNQALAIEPMISAGDFRTKVAPDGWTVQTVDGSLSAHFEHTVLIENGKAVIVTMITRG